MGWPWNHITNKIYIIKYKISTIQVKNADYLEIQTSSEQIGLRMSNSRGNTISKKGVKVENPIQECN